VAAREREGLWGQAFSPIGEKGRVTLPTFARKKIRDSSEGRVLCLASHEKLPCLIGYGMGRVDTFEEQLKKEEKRATKKGEDFDAVTRGAQLYGFVEVSFDDSGRFILPEQFRHMVDMDAGLYFHGAGSLVTVWNPVHLQAMDDRWAQAKINCASLMETAEAKAAKK